MIDFTIRRPLREASGEEGNLPGHMTDMLWIPHACQTLFKEILKLKLVASGLAKLRSLGLKNNRKCVFDAANTLK